MRSIRQSSSRMISPNGRWNLNRCPGCTMFCYFLWRVVLFAIGLGLTYGCSKAFDETSEKRRKAAVSATFRISA